MGLQEQFMSKEGRIAVRLAALLSTMRVGERLPAVKQVAAELEASNGTIQGALTQLTDLGAVQLKPRGRLGTFIEALDYPLLWEASGGRSISIGTPMPYSLRYEAMASALQASFADAGIPLSLMFQRGSTERARSVMDGHTDFALMSRLAAESSELNTIRDFGPNTYVGSHGLIITRGRDRHDPTLRVGVDSKSTDQVTLTARYFPDLDDERLVDVSYHQLAGHFDSGLIDATVWNLDEVSDHLRVPIDIYPLPEIEGNTNAVLVHHHSNVIPWPVRRAIDSPLAMTVFAEVLAGKRPPTY
ncbi:YhfZ family protein [Enemella sp. A6]|uniref:YhfZ family protein n=1 Tax=Enemella sp. A6 TaxID=3440152 RepID=UPI003EBD950A